ncbi:HPP family protein [Candidatus Amarolinea aalborgensis]|jgi:CBS domain-containing protein|uniref:CBS domain-containing protein n=1 Tax=Candidatus Amarolinea aalborgensis TaxID=2249329 RepID=UPI003BF955E6
MPYRTVLEAKRLGIFSCLANDTLELAARRIAEEDISGMVVVDSQGFLAGVITRIDLLRAFVNSPEWKKEPVSAYMSPHVITVHPDTRLIEVAHTLLQNHVHRVVVVREEGDKQRPIAVIGDTDLVYNMMRASSEDD